MSDLDDLRALLKIHRACLNMDELREYFALFNKPELLNELLDEPIEQSQTTRCKDAKRFWPLSSVGVSAASY